VLETQVLKNPPRVVIAVQVAVIKRRETKRSNGNT
jgi:hypothetical protein